MRILLKVNILGFCLVLFLSLICCSKDGFKQPDFPNQRSFYMGFTAFPNDLTQQALDETFQNVIQNGDVLLVHFDNGIPWNEALNNLPFPTEIQSVINQSINAVTANHKIVLTTSATDLSRANLAKYWNDNGTHQELPTPWDTYDFDDPDIIEAYINYCKRIIDAIQPDYFAYGIEVNPNFIESSDKFNAYLILADTVYNELKQVYPSLPIFLTFQDQSFNKNKDELHRLTKILLDYSDMIAVSTYPFWQFGFSTQDANPSLFTDNWLKEMRDLAPNKPFAVSETGFIAEDLIMDDILVNIKGTEQWQADYVQKLCTEANKLDAEFILWFVYRDYDLLYDALPNPPSYFKIWKDNGLLDGTGNKRTAYSTWDTWKQLSVK